MEAGGRETQVETPSAAVEIDRARIDAAREAAQGRWLIVLAALLWSTNGLFAKAPDFDSWPADSRGMVLAFWRALFAGLFLLCVVRRRESSLWQVPAGVVFAGLSITFLVSLTWTTAANAIWLQSTAPLWVCGLALVFLGRQPARDDRWTLVFLSLGLALIVGCELSQSTSLGQQQYGVILAVLSGGCFGATVLLMEKMRDLDAAWVVAINHLAAAAILSPILLSAAAPTLWQLQLLVLFGVLQMGLPYLLFFHALRKLPIQEAAGLTLLEPILSPIWVLLRYGEVPRWWTIVGAVLILLGLGWRYLGLWMRARAVRT